DRLIVLEFRRCPDPIFVRRNGPRPKHTRFQARRVCTSWFWRACYGLSSCSSDPARCPLARQKRKSVDRKAFSRPCRHSDRPAFRNYGVGSSEARSLNRQSRLRADDDPPVSDDTDGLASRGLCLVCSNSPPWQPAVLRLGSIVVGAFSCRGDAFSKSRRTYC